MARRRDQPIVYRARGGESLCHLAVAYGFPHCQRLRDENPDLVDRSVLRRGDRVTIPPLEEATDGGPDRSRNRFRRPNYPLPNVWFIKENGAGYPDPEPAPDDRGYNRHYPRGDPRIRTLAISNYHVERAGNGTDNFAAATDFLYHTPSSQDPDHFKIQVYDNKVPEGTDEVMVKLFAMRPSYRRRRRGSTEIIQWTSSYFYPTAGGDRELDVVCHRVGQTNYFRSPYLRLVTSETCQAARPLQTLLVKDYFDDGANDDQKWFTEILHHKVRASYTVEICVQQKCKIHRDARIRLDREVRMAMHIMDGSGATRNDVRTAIYKWMRRSLAQANVRPHIKVFHEVDIPDNMITVSDGDGRYASGVTGGAAGAPRSEMTIAIDGTDYTHRPRAGDSPRATAVKLKRLLRRNRFRVKGPYRVKVDGLTPVRGQVSNPYEILVFDRDWDQVVVDSVSSTDRPNASGQRGQPLILTDDINVDRFEVNWPYQGRWPRAMYYNYRTRYFDLFICGNELVGMWDPGGSQLLGLGPYGPYNRNDTDIGPVGFIRRDVVQLGATDDPYTGPHELLHPLMHVCHTVNTANPDGLNETMYASGTGADAVNSAKHIADAPIAMTYETLIRGGHQVNVVLDGERQALAGGRHIRDTPVRRFRRVGAHYRYLTRASPRRVDRS